MRDWGTVAVLRTVSMSDFVGKTVKELQQFLKQIVAISAGHLRVGLWIRAKLLKTLTLKWIQVVILKIGKRWSSQNYVHYKEFCIHDDVIKWKHFPRYWPFVRGIHRSPVNSPHKGQWRRALMVFFCLHPNKRLSKQWLGWWFETQSCPLWRHRNNLPELFVKLITGYHCIAPDQYLWSQPWPCNNIARLIWNISSCRLYDDFRPESISSKSFDHNFATNTTRYSYVAHLVVSVQ